LVAILTWLADREEPRNAPADVLSAVEATSFNLSSKVLTIL
jgi:hypothetical protein